MSYNLTTMQSIYHGQDEIVEITYNGSSIYHKSSGPDYTEPFYVENTSNENETLNIVKNDDRAPTLTIEYSTDKTVWNTFGTTSTTALTRTLQAGDKLYLRCSTNSWYASYSYNTITGVSKVGGNIMSLLYGSNFTGQETNFPSESTNNLFLLFYNNTRLIDASNLLLPATTLAESCYTGMFFGCTALTTAPELPATTLANGCYQQMFYGCTSLTTAPALPATTLATYCYNNMFYGCTSLTSAPALPATTLAQSCYDSMFNGCTSLTSAPALPATTLAQSCYNNMFSGCTSLTSAPALPATTLADYCYQSMFDGCTSLTTAPALPATTLAESCYSGMFYNCTSLTSAPALPATTLADSCYDEMFYGCTSLTTAPELPATTLADYCYQSMFNGCTELTTAPELPATTLADSCYQSMFDGCRSLNNVKCLAENGFDSGDPTYTWLDGVADDGTFVKKSGVSWESGEDGIPYTWSVIEV